MAQRERCGTVWGYFMRRQTRGVAYTTMSGARPSPALRHRVACGECRTSAHLCSGQAKIASGPINNLVPVARSDMLLLELLRLLEIDVCNSLRKCMHDPMPFIRVADADLRRFPVTTLSRTSYRSDHVFIVSLPALPSVIPRRTN